MKVTAQLNYSIELTHAVVEFGDGEGKIISKANASFGFFFKQAEIAEMIEALKFLEKETKSKYE